MAANDSRRWMVFSRLLAAAFAAAALVVRSPPAARASEAARAKAGMLLAKAGRLRHSLAVLERARPQNEDEWIDRLFQLGLVEARLGLPRKAAVRFEATLARRPELTRVRLELASAYYAAGLDEKARFHFESALSD